MNNENQYIEPDVVPADLIQEDYWYQADMELPPMHKYVLVGFREMPCYDEGDNDGAHYKVMCRDVMKGLKLKGNNGTYEWVEFGDGKNYCAQDVTCWMMFSRDFRPLTL